MNAIIEQTPRSITVRMSKRRWNKMLELEQAYKLATKRHKTVTNLTCGQPKARKRVV